MIKLSYLGHSKCPRLHHCTKEIRTRLPWISIHTITGYSLRLVCKSWCKKRKASIFLHFFGFWGILPQTPLVKCECIYFCAKVRISIDLGTKFGLLIIKKMLIFRLIITNFGTFRMHHIAPFLSKLFPGEHAPEHLAQVIINIITGLPSHLECNSLWLFFLLKLWWMLIRYILTCWNWS